MNDPTRAHSITIDRLTVLLVEPSGIQEKIIRGQLHEVGVPLENIETAGDGRQALEVIRNHHPDLVISAMYLEDMTGVELVETLHSSDELADVGYILISSETSITMLEPIRQAGAIAILPKPFETEQLRHALYATLDFLEPPSLELDPEAVERMALLLVDDSFTSRRHLRRMLEGMGIDNVTEATNGVEAMELINAQFFDAIITDLNMPEMDGNELITRIRNESTQPGVPVLMVTSETDRSRLAQVEHAGVSAVCNKPFEPETIRQLLQASLAQAME